MRNVYDDEDNKDFIRCATCKREVGKYDENHVMVLLYDYRKCLLVHVSTTTDSLGNEGSTTVIENRLNELGDYDEARVAIERFLNSLTMHSTFCSAQKELFPGDNTIKNPESLENAVEESENSENAVENPDFSILCDEFMPNESELQAVPVDVVMDSGRGEFVDNVPVGGDQPGRSKIEFLPVELLPTRDATHDIIDPNLAILLPGEELPVFEY